ncbi:ROK family protein [Streptomyces sp. NPDC001315]|uniref:ROK family protein n=1 Tax=Streptomyces sp. NPDC001315 TaxID=3364562 RepID=UPI0036B38250
MVNDAKMAALAEYHALTAQDGETVSTVAYAKVAGLIVGGRIYPGSHGLAGELGHISRLPRRTRLRVRRDRLPDHIHQHPRRPGRGRARRSCLPS